MSVPESCMVSWRKHWGGSFIIITICQSLLLSTRTAININCTFLPGSTLLLERQGKHRSCWRIRTKEHVPVAQRKVRVREVREGFLEEVVQAYLGAIAGSVPDHHSTVSHNLFAGGGSCPQFIKKKNQQHLWSTIKWKTTKWGMPILELTLKGRLGSGLSSFLKKEWRGP